MLGSWAGKEEVAGRHCWDGGGTRRSRAQVQQFREQEGVLIATKRCRDGMQKRKRFCEERGALSS